MRFCHLFLRREGVLGIGRLVVSLLRRCITFTAKSASYTVDDSGRGTGKIIRDLNGSLGSGQFLNVALIKGHVLHRARAHLKVPG